MDGPGNCDYVEVEQVFVGAGCNRIVNNVSWGPSGLVSFGAQNAVAVFSPETAQICTTLPGHRATVNCTHWIPSVKDAPKVQPICRQFLLSGGADGTIILWETHAKDMKWRQVLQLPHPHKKGVTCIMGYMISQDVAIFASTSSDCSVVIWNMVFTCTAGVVRDFLEWWTCKKTNLDATAKFLYCNLKVTGSNDGKQPLYCGGDCTLSCLETFSVGPRPMVTLSLSEIPGKMGQMILALGGLDHKIHLYCGERTGKFTPACVLKGHTDWIRSLDFSSHACDREENTIFLASSSQDRSIRIWKVVACNAPSHDEPHKKEISLMSYVEGPLFVAGSNYYQVSLESLLVGHEDWVYSVAWHPLLLKSHSSNKLCQPHIILSASMDKTMMIWKPEKTTGIWINAVTVGELSHCALGFYGGHWSPNGKSILAHGYGGSFHLWKNTGVDNENWVPQKVPSGHFAVVSDIAWAKTGDYLLSVSHDQTARTFAPWKRECAGVKASWHEIARPQVHGHDINCAALVKGKGNHRFISGADEKVARVFEAPLSFLKTLEYADFQKSSSLEDLQEEVHVLGANMSALGLSQKPIYVNATNDVPSGRSPDVSDTLEAIPDSVPRILTEPPVEEQLAWHTLWPETHKLYGHGNELVSLCCNHKGNLVASSCKAQSATFAEIWLWEVGTWKAVGRLQSHCLTVIQMEFSSDDAFLLSVSRDRQFSVFSLDASAEGEVRHRLVARHEAHKRIIWSCSWNPFKHEFATGSRDKFVKIWGVDEVTSFKHLLTLPQFGSSVMALSWLGCDRTSDVGFLAIGMESGLIELWRTSCEVKTSKHAAVPVVKFDHFLCHVSAVNRLTWKDADIEDSKITQLASCGADHCVRVFQIQF